MKYLICFYMFAFAGTIYGQNASPPGRVSWLGAYGKYSSEGMTIDSVAQGSSLEKAALMRGDVLVSINEIAVNNLQELRRSVRNVRENSELRIVHTRNGKTIKQTVSAAPLPLVKDPKLHVQYGWVPFRNGKLRSIAYTKNSTTSKVPFILLVPGYNCSSIENFQNTYNGKLIHQLTEAGFGVFTIEKSGIGDSYGCEPCEEVDLATDIESFQAGYKQMAGLTLADTEKLYIFGHSMGGVIAPIIANNARESGIPSNGVIAFATVFRPWFEFLLEMHRIQAPLEGKSYNETEAFVRQMQKVYYEFFVNKKSPAQIAKIPELHKTAVSELDYKPNSSLLWGRHWKFWQQLDSIDLAKEWSALDVPVLSVFGGADYIACSELEHQLITKTVNSTHPGNATHITIPDIDHIMVQNKDWQSSMEHIADGNYMRAHYHEGLGNEIIKWINKKDSTN